MFDNIITSFNFSNLELTFKNEVQFIDFKMNTISNRWKRSFSELWREENNGISRLRKLKIKN
jgi:hypothetical protein